MQNNFYLNGLNGLRALAALIVVVSHVELIKLENKLPNIFSTMSNWGNLGVNLFFVLSGFLITTLLLREKKKTTRINLKNFYIRRVLRIWPLYFLVLIGSYLIFDFSPSNWTLLLCATIFPNLAHAFSIGWAVSPQIWSIGVEEQFYLFWPTILKLKDKTILIFCIALIFLYPIIPHLIAFSAIRLEIQGNTTDSLIIFFQSTSFNAMATGAVFAILMNNQNLIFIKMIDFSKYLNILLVCLPFALLFLNIDFSYFQTSVYSVIFAIQIVLITKGNLNQLFESKILKFLGEISYGIYMFHWIILVLMIKFIRTDYSNNQLLFNTILYAGTIGFTVLISFLSFKFLESPILKWKNKFY